MNHAPLLEVTDLCKHFAVGGGLFSRPAGWVQAVNGISFSIDCAESLGLVGESGCGKTTLLRSLLGLCDCEGQLDVLGFDPRYERSKMLDQVCSIADTAVLPGWIPARTSP